MKRLIIGLLGGCVVACQHHAPPATTAAAPHLAAPAAVPRVSARPVAPARVGADSLSPAMRAFARRHDLSAVWQGREEVDTTGATAPTVCDGFFGPDHYRIELVLLQVTRDATDPLIYHVRGKDRFKRQVAAFAGTLRLRKLRRVSVRNFAEELQGEFARFYTALGDFSWQETGSAGSGTFSGTLGIDFQQQADSSLVSTYFRGDDDQQFAHGGRMYLTGDWVAAQSGRRKSLLAGASIEYICEQVFADFNVGERSFHINPKYAKLGWNTLWENEEWWADSPAATSAL